jgi:hypothetical protein
MNYKLKKPPSVNMKNKTFCFTDNTMGKKPTAPWNSYRLAALVVTLASLAILVVAALVTPNPRGVGTHKQLGLTACGFYERTGYPCPTCGMTTAFAHMVRGRIWNAFAVQPAGALAALLCAFTFLTGTYVTFTGKSLDQYTSRLNVLRVLLIVALVVLASWLWLCALTYMRST